MTDNVIDISTQEESRLKKLLPSLVVGALRLQLETLRVKRGALLTLVTLIIDYMQEHVMPQKDVEHGRYIYVFNHILRLLDPKTPATAIGRATAREYTAKRKLDGVVTGTIRRELTLLLAAVNHAFKEDRLAKPLSFKGVMPPASPPRQRYLLREEFAKLMATPMPPRIFRFFMLDFMCGVRSRAIEELTWDRVNFKDRTIDFRVPGVSYKNKRRPVQPIIDALLPLLEQWYAERADDYVIGLGAHGKASTTFHRCKVVMRAAGINEKGVCRHVGRHTVVSWLLQGDGIKPPAPMLHVAQYIADKAATIEKTYAHISTQHVHGSVNSLH